MDLDLPMNIDDLSGRLYTLTHPKSVRLDDYRPLLISCFEGEHGDIAKAIAFAMADHVHIEVPPLYTRPDIQLTINQQSGIIKDK